jgi:RNA polymerase sigma-70 factor (ECF subfamily)
MSSDLPFGTGRRHDRRFATTSWTLVANAGRRGTAESRAALEELCRAYWFPLYAFLRRQGRSAEESQDLTQAFFARLLEKNALASADRERGRFRSFLLKSLQNFATNEWHKEQAARRGGGIRTLSLDFAAGESRCRLEAVDPLTPERHFERQWATTLLARVLERLESDCRAAGRGEQFAALKGFLAGSATRTLSEVGEELGLSEDAAKQAVHRLRRKYRDLLRDEVARTVHSPDDVDDELRHLLECLGN